MKKTAILFAACLTVGTAAAQTPAEDWVHLEWKQRTPLCSRVATGISWSSLGGLKGVKPPEAFGERSRDWSLLSAGLDDCRLGGIGRGIALDARLGGSDGQLDEERRLDAEDIALVGQHLDDLLLLDEIERIADDVLADRDLLIGLHVHEVEQVAVVVAVLHILALDKSGRELCSRVEGCFNHSAGDDVLVLGTDERCALARLNVLEFENLNNLTVHFKGHAVAKIAC